MKELPYLSNIRVRSSYAAEDSDQESRQASPIGSPVSSKVKRPKVAKDLEDHKSSIDLVGQAEIKVVKPRTTKRQPSKKNKRDEEPFEFRPIIMTRRERKKLMSDK